MGVLVQRPGRHQVHHQTDGGDDEHRDALHLLRLEQPPPCLVEDTDGDEENRGAVDERGGRQHQ